MKIEIEIPVGKVAKWVDGVLTLVDEKPQDVTECIKTFEDACRELGESHPLVKEWQMCGQNLSHDLEAYLRLRIITAALNEGWKPSFIPGEYRWAPYFVLYTKEEIDKMNAEAKARVVHRSNFNAGAFGGVSYAYADYGSAAVFASIGSRLAFKSEKLAAYAGRQFAEIYADFCFKPNEDVCLIKSDSSHA